MSTFSQQSLFDQTADNRLENDIQNISVEEIQLPDASLFYYPNLFQHDAADGLFAELYEQIAWQQETITMHGKQMPVPRLSAWYGDKGKDYTYSGILHKAQPWNKSLLTIKQAVEAVANTTFNSVLCNLYRNEKDSVAWHSDDEPELGKTPIIASVSFGAERYFQFRRKDDTAKKFHLNLAHGSCLIMQGKTQECWQHQIAKLSEAISPRINLTFRAIFK